VAATSKPSTSDNASKSNKASTSNKVSRGRAAATTSQVAPRWLVITSFVLTLAGLALSIYLTITHYTDQATLFCQQNSVVNCLKVTTSPESVIFGIPVAVLGLVFFVPMVLLNSPWGWRSPLPLLRWLRLAGVALGLVFVVYLVSAELVLIGSICEYCTGVHIVTVALFIVVVIGQYRMSHRED
jgi:uncharacterized membrane protein